MRPPRYAAAEPSRALDDRARTGHRRVQLAHGGDVQRMTGLHRDDFELRAHAEQREVADEVEHFVPYDLIRESQRPHVAVALDDHRVVERTALGEPLRVEPIDLRAEAERAVRRDLAEEILRRDRTRRDELLADRMR